MGRVLDTVFRMDAREHSVRAHLESDRLTLRGGLRLDLSFAELAAVCSDGDWLRFAYSGQPCGLALGPREGALWLRHIMQPPSLADKLGLRKGHANAWSLGTADPELELLLAPFRSQDPKTATLCFLVLRLPGDLDELPGQLARLSAAQVVWTIREKGKHAAVGEADLRAAMTRAGWTATKTARFSDTRSADRWHPKRGP